MVFLLALATSVPPRPCFCCLVIQISLHGLREQYFGLLRQARHVDKPCRPAARTHTHEALLRLPMQGLGADVARLPLRVVRAFLDRDRDGLRALLISIVLFGAAPELDLFAFFLVPCLPVQLLAVPIAVGRRTVAASRRCVGQQFAAGGAACADHLRAAQ